MADQSQLHAGSTVEDAVASILRSVLPPAFHDDVARCARLVMQRAFVARYAATRWIALSETESERIAREVGDVAAQWVIVAAPSENGGEPHRDR